MTFAFEGTLNTNLLTQELKIPGVLNLQSLVSRTSGLSIRLLTVWISFSKVGLFVRVHDLIACQQQKHIQAI